MNNIQNYGITNYQVGFKANQGAKKLVTQQLGNRYVTNYFREMPYESFPQKVIEELKTAFKKYYETGEKQDLTEKLNAFKSLLAKNKPVEIVSPIMSPDGDMLLIKNFDSTIEKQITELFKKGLSVEEIEAKLNLVRREHPVIK